LKQKNKRNQKNLPILKQKNQRNQKNLPILKQKNQRNQKNLPILKQKKLFKLNIMKNQKINFLTYILLI